ARRERPHGCRAAEQSDEVAASAAQFEEWHHTTPLQEMPGCDARLHRRCRQPYLFQRRQRAQPHDPRVEIVLSHFAEVDVARHRRFEGAAIAAYSFDKCLLDLGIGPAADAFSWMRGDVRDLRNTPNVLEFVSALPP